MSMHPIIDAKRVLIDNTTMGIGTPGSNATCCNDNASTSNTSTGRGNYEWDEFYHLNKVPHTLATIVLLSCLVTLIIACTLIGNTLVCLAVGVVRKLRKQPANYLLISLAVADLCVGFMVMPLAFLYLILGRWPFGQFLCDVWTSADVTLCTASILNLCAISLDRYLAIVRPLTYCPQRTGKRMLIYILIVWVLAFLISFLPPIAFWTPSPAGRCEVNQNMAYQVYATMGAFYIPATIIMVVNYKIFKAARRLTLADKRASALSGSATSTMVAAAAVFVAATPVVQQTNTPSTNTSSTRFSIRNMMRSPTIISYARRRKLDSQDNLKIDRQDDQTDHAYNDCTVLSNHVAPILPITQHTVLTATPSNGGILQYSRSWRDRLKPMRRSFSKQITEAFINSRSSSQRGNSKSGGSVRYQMRDQQISINSQTRRRGDWASRSNSKTVHTKLMYSHSHSRQSSYHRHREHATNTSTETKAMKTLGLIMGCFVACWLPFFTVTLLKALCPDQCAVPVWLDNLVLWLGYANSTINPILYAKYNKDFRIPFREILCCRFSTLKSVLRMETYLETMGSFPDSLDGIGMLDANSNMAPINAVISNSGALSPRIFSEENGVSKSQSSPAALNGQHDIFL